MRAARVLPTVLVAAAALVLAAPAAGQEPATPPAAGQPAPGAIDKARELVKKRRYVEALTVLRPLARQRPVPVDALFLVGFAGIEASQQPGISEEARDALLDAAIQALRTMLVRNPGLVRVRLELARAFFFKGDDRLARRHFERILASKPPAAVALNVNRFLNQIRVRRRWSMHFGFSLAPDSNIGAGSEERLIYIHGLPFRRDQEELTTSGVGVSVWGGGEYQHPLGERLRLRAGADISRREYRQSRFDQMTVSGHLGPRWLVDERTEASVLASARQHWLGDGPDHRDLGVRLETGRRLGPRITANARASWYGRRYEERTHLDGPVADLSLGAAFVASPTVRLNASLGLGRRAGGPRALAQHPSLGAHGDHRRPALGLHRGGERHRAVDRVRGQLVPPHRGRRAPPGPHPEPSRLRAPPRLHCGWLQPAALPGAPSAQDQRPALRL